MGSTPTIGFFYFCIINLDMGSRRGSPLHSWDLAPREAAALQERLRRRLLHVPYRGWPALVAGVDTSCESSWPAPGRTPCRAWGCAIVYEAEPAEGRLRLREVERAWAGGLLTFPYIPGFLSFREAPLLIEAVGRLKRRPDVLFCDAQGTAHPRGFGEACHLGLWLDLPSAGVAKSLLVGEAAAPGARAGAHSLMRYQGRVVGAALRTRDGTKPVYVSPGHRMDLESALRLALACCDGLRIPVPTREADRWSKELRRARAA